MPLSQSKGFGGGLVYWITIVPLIVILGFYFLERIPSREEYFLNLHFRTLSVIGKQIETKLEAVSSGLTYGRSMGWIDQALPDGSKGRIFLEKYVPLVFPGLLPAEAQQKWAAGAEDPTAIDPGIKFLLSGRIQFTVSPVERRWEDSFAHLIRPLTEDTSFEDVLLADEKGKVLFQRSDSAPRVREVASLLKKPDTKDSGVLPIFHRLHSDGSGSDTDLLRDVELDGSGYHFLIQPLTIRVPRSRDGNVVEMLLCGVIRSNTVRQDAMHVPPRYLLWIIVPLFAGLLSGPLLKLILIRRTGRLETRDPPLLALFSCLAMGMLTIMLLAYHLSGENTERLELGSQALADNVATQVRQCFGRGRRVAQEVDNFAVNLDRGKADSQVALNRTRVWSWPGLVKDAPDIKKTNLEFIYWTSLDGFQIEKWTPLETNTPFYPQRSYTSYQQAIANQYWTDTDDPRSPFTAELLISPTTSVPIAVLTMKSNRTADLKLTAERRVVDPLAPASLKPALVSVVETPRNLLSPVIPPAMGFALVLRDGSVLYHSDHDRILNENLFQETGNSPALVEAVATQSASRIAGRYRGSDVSFYVRPIREVTGIPWTIVVFREIEPWQSLVWQVGLDVLLLYLLLWALPVLAVPAILFGMTLRTKNSWNECRIMALRYFWPKDNASGCYRRVVSIECGLIVVFLALLAWFGKRPDGVAGMVLLISGFLLPASALVVWILQMRRLPSPPAGEHSPRWRPIYVVALSLTLICSSVLPVTAFFHLAFRMESEIDIRHWQADLADRELRHRAAAEAEIRQPERLSPNDVDDALKVALPPPGSKLCDSEQLYESRDHTTIECASTKLPFPEKPAWIKALGFFRFSAVGLAPETVAVGEFGNVTRTGVSEPMLAVSRAGFPPLVVKSKLPSLTLLPRSIGWWALAGILLSAGCVWVWSAASRLFLFDFYEIRLRTLGQLQCDDLNHPILVLGLPRTGKDSAVREFINRVETPSGGLKEDDPQRDAVRAKVDLKTDTLDEAWLKLVLKNLGLGTFYAPPAVELESAAEIKSTEPLAAAAAASGDSSSTGVAAQAQGRPDSDWPDKWAAADRGIPKYVHVTNLEAAIYDRGRRDIAMRLLDALVRAQAAGGPRLLVTSVVDPMFHFDIIFPDQNEEVDRSQLPEAEFGHWAHVFIQFERVLVEEKSDMKEEAACRKAFEGDDLWEECRHHRSLRRTGQMIAKSISQRLKAGEDPPTHRQLVDELYEKAFVLYKLLWSACTRPEKLLLVQLAQTGLVNPICKVTLHDLIRKKLVVLNPYPAVMNESFTRFLLSAATSDQIQAWEKEAGESRWLIVRNVLIIMLVFAFLMIGISQDRILQSISGILTAVVGGIGGVFKLAETIGSKWAGKSNAPAKA